MKTALLLFACSFVAYLFKGTTGFGDALVFVSTAGLFFELTWVVPLALLLAFVNNTYMTIRLRSGAFLHKRPALLAGMIGGIVAGVVLFSHLTAPALRYCVASIVILVALHELIGETADDDRPIHDWVDGGVGLFAGLSGGLFGMAGPPLVGYVRLHCQRVEFRKLIVPFFAITTGVACLIHLYNGVYAAIDPMAFVATFAGLTGGTLAGMPLIHYVNERLFSILIALFLIGASAGLLA